jgi:hypothetical protein
MARERAREGASEMKTEAEPKGGTTNNNNDTIVSKGDHPSHQHANSNGDTTIHMLAISH